MIRISKKYEFVCDSHLPSYIQFLQSEYCPRRSFKELTFIASNIVFDGSNRHNGLLSSRHDPTDLERSSALASGVKNDCCAPMMLCVCVYVRDALVGLRWTCFRLIFCTYQTRRVQRRGPT
jgi:hypothetical protein